MKLSHISEEYVKSIESTFGDQRGKASPDSLDYSGLGLQSLFGGPEHASRSFNCNSNQLTSLEHAPLKVGEAFSCSNNGLKSLEHCPEVGDSFLCDNNNLTSLEHIQAKIRGMFSCRNNNLESLEHGPSTVIGTYNCGANYLTSLKGAPTELDGDFVCRGNNLRSLEGAPAKIKSLDCSNNHLTSLKGIHKIFTEIDGEANFTRNDISSHVLGLLKIKGLKEVSMKNTRVENILNEHLSGERNIFACQADLEDQGLDDYAQL